MKLNILCCNPDGGAFYYITKGWEDAFKALGHNFERWDGTDDLIKKLKPHIYLGCSGWRQNYPQWARKEFGTKIGIHVNPWGSKPVSRFKGEPDINEQHDSIKWVEKQKPDFLYCYGLNDDISVMWDNWIKNIAPVAPMPNAGNSILHFPVAGDNNFKCQIGFIGGRWPYKAMNIDRYLMPIIEIFDSKVYGWGGWKTSKYKGKISDHDVNKLFSSAKICPSIVEPHTSRIGIDVPERMFKVPLGGGFTICDPCYGLDRYVPQEIFPMANNPKEYLELIKYYLKNEDKRLELKTKQRMFVLKNHTYLNRIQNFMTFAGFKDEALDAQRKVDEIYHSHFNRDK